MWKRRDIILPHLVLFYLSYVSYGGMLRRTRKKVVVKIRETVALIDLFCLCFTNTIFQEACTK